MSEYKTTTETFQDYIIVTVGPVQLEMPAVNKGQAEREQQLQRMLDMARQKFDDKFAEKYVPKTNKEAE